jgi:phosphatidylglycerophosphatase A
MGIICKYIATLFFIGYIPVAPGTFGTLAAFILYIFLKPPLFVQILLLCFIIPIGTVSAHQAEKALEAKDSRHIVIDEFCGYFCSLLFVPFSIAHATAAFFLFRIFDILKPFPIRRMEVVFQGGIAVMADDIMAAVYTNIILQIWRHVQ